MKLSIITPSFNQSRFLEATIRSVLTQKTEIEYIIVDGGSPDGSVEIIRRYADRLAWWVSEPDEGQADAIRKGFSRASGEILAWLNSDDLLAPGAVTTALAALEANPEAVFVYGNAVSIDAEGRPLNDMLFRTYSLENLAAFQIICQPAVFFRRAAYEQAGGLDPAYHFLLDHDLWLRMLSAGHAVHVPELWAFARQHPDAKNVAQADRFGEEAARIVNHLRSDPRFGDLYLNNQRKIEAAAQRFGARYLLDAGRAGPALRGYLRSFAIHPATALVEWPRMLFSGLSVLGLGALGGLYYRRKRQRGAGQVAGVENVRELY